MDVRESKLAPYTIPNLKVYKNGNTRLIGVKSIKWFKIPHRTITVKREGEHQPIEYTAFNPGSRSHIRKWMEDDYGYTFPYYTPNGTAKVDVDSLENMTNPAGKLLKRYLKVIKDQSQIGGDGGSLLGHYNSTTHAIHGRVDTNGTATGRFTSSSPNLAQIPAQQEFRELFNAPVYYNIPNNLYVKIKPYVKELNENNRHTI